VIGASGLNSIQALSMPEFTCMSEVVMIHDDMVYCDHNATTPMRASAIEAMTRWLQEPANPSSGHWWGRQAARAVEAAREQVAMLIGAQPREVIFTSGSTEANNIALRAAVNSRPGARLITTVVEHAAVLAVAKAHDGSVLVGVNEDGTVDREALLRALQASPGAVVSVMAANNETGAVNDMPTVGELTRQSDCILHTDATQAVGKIPVNVDKWGVDMLSLSAHKFGGPMGTGALFVRRGARLPVHSVFSGGSQERGWRPGTVNVAGVAALGAAAEGAAAAALTESARIRKIRDMFEDFVLRARPEVRRNCANNARLPGVSSLTVPGRPADALLAAMPHIAASEGSACSSGSLEPSHVLLAIGHSRSDALSTVRFSFGHTNVLADAHRAAKGLLAAIEAVDSALTYQRTATSPADDLTGALI
jgi:cysteine desulfurase